ncbi:putative drug antiporter protein precursor [Rhizocola hellebori]|uniref:Multidrug efflux pump Tap n=1 Tax=Rhizocola hellebori TaxID=1392758 RepID=A0A8J3QD40_9ACTN|nr:MFS transporter [Rhizocola hellebori]GIH08446.1 putative drug antiporter protein precursor [Rhizocola hellebori]
MARPVPLLLLESATALSGIGNGVVIVALPWLILERTGNAAIAGLIAACTAVPLLAASVFAGTLVDMVGRRRIAVLSDVLSALAVLAIPVADLTVGLSVGLLLGLAVIGAMFDPAGLTARETMLPAAAQAARWPIDRVNSVHESVWGLAYLIGPGLGGVLIARVGAVHTLWVTGVCFLLSALLVRFIAMAGVGHPPSRPANVRQAVLEGLRFVWRDRLLRTLGLLMIALIVLYLPIEGVVLPVYFQSIAAPQRLGATVMAMSAGGIAGSLLFGVFVSRVPRRATFIGGVVLSGLALLGMSFLPPFPLLLAFAALSGLAYGPVNPLANYAMQQRSPERLRGRVVGLMSSSAYAAGPAGFLLAGPLVQGIGVKPAFVMLAAAFLAIALLTTALPVLRELDRPA